MCCPLDIVKVETFLKPQFDLIDSGIIRPAMASLGFNLDLIHITRQVGAWLSSIMFPLQHRRLPHCEEREAHGSTDL